jgi:3-hydroxybutyryl-CoA dehydrogenase
MIKNVGVIGAGTMGHGIAQVAAQSKLSVVMLDINDELVNKGLARIEKAMRKGVEKGRWTEEHVEETMKLLRGTTDMKDLANCDIVIEAATENVELKKKIFKDVDNICMKDAILATNTSSISITELASVVSNQERFIGMHFMNPVPVMKLVEIINGMNTNEATTTTIRELTEKMGKVPIVVKDAPGFIANRILMPMINEAVFCLMEGISTKEDIDTVMKLGTNHPMGPLELADLIGLDVCLSIMNVLHEDFKDSKYRPCPLLVKMVRAGRLGRKTGRGFYDHNK